MAETSGGLSVSLFHWNEEELAERVPRLEEAGLRVVQGVWDSGRGFVAELEEAAPDAVVIDLGRLPSHGREVALYLRRRKKSRGLPLVFVVGSPEKVGPIRELLPDAGRFWIAWPKKASEMESDLAQSLVQSAALERGFVDYKVCAIDDTWSGLLFSRRRD